MPPIIPAVPRPQKETNQAPQPGPEDSVPRSRVLGLDVGARRIGIAVSDELRLLARGLPTLKRQSKRLDLDHLASIVDEYTVAEVVIGHPVRLGGEASAQTAKVAAFAAELRQRLGLPVHLWDERLTSVDASAMLPRSRSVREHIAQRQSGEVDRIAAVLILQGFLDEMQRRKA